MSLGPDGNDADITRLKALFVARLPVSQNIGSHLAAALQHVLSTPGSLSRPRVVLRVATAYGLSTPTADDLAMALEYFHTASLIFDDLPSMDNATERRGIACAHVAFGEAEAILAALALVNRAYALIWRTVAQCPHDNQPAAIDYIELNLGTEGLLNGQSLDLQYASLPHDRHTTERIAFGKTVSLIRLALVLPAILAGAPPSELLLLERIAKYWGFSYQIIDDLKDVLHSSTDIGKTTARDSLLDRPNVSIIMGTAAAIERLHRLIRIGDTALQRLVVARPPLAFLEALRNDLRKQAGLASEAASQPVTLVTP